MDSMNENVIEWIKGEKRAHITAANGTRLKGRILKLAENDQVIITVQNKDGSICATVPVDWIRINPSRQLTEEQKQEYAERARKNLHSTKEAEA